MFATLFINDSLLTVVGCADLLTPEDACTDDMETQLGLDVTSRNKTWVLKCNDNRWDGVVGTCDTSGGVIITNDNAGGGQAEWSLFSFGKS